MNREIKFRGKDCTGEWWYGNLEINRKITDEKTYESYSISNVYSSAFTSMIDKETIGQFTGLHDKNGKEIYEGDIIRFLCSGINTWEMPVEWNNESATYLLIGRCLCDVRHENCTDWMKKYFRKDGVFEVIGNIHDNSEFLKTE